ncbi:MAG: hypothetical protein LBJ31_10565, partial [Treponema sp.]|nr:hypothetical protein [Treponema sp.]
MAIESLYTACFRNLADQETNTAAHDIFLVGENGQGKTNFLEALYFCCYASSFRASKDAEIVRQGENHFAASAVLKNGPAVQSTTPPQADGVCCSHKVFDSGSIPLVPPQGAGVWTLRNES